MYLKIAFITLIFISLNSYGQTKTDRTKLVVEFAKSELKEALSSKNEKQILVEQVIADKETAITIAETILFKIYGKNNIISQRPYEINKFDEYWVLNGTLPKNMKGGTFLIILNSTNGQIIKLTHGK
ncbi:MAG: hypothetical protein ACI9EK_002733 [Psychroserpens sp.]|jgi:hypothetical protein